MTEVVRVRCPHRIGLCYRDGGMLRLLPCDCNDASEVLEVVANLAALPATPPAAVPADEQAAPTAGEEATITMPAHHLVGMDLGLTCTNCGGHTATTAPCIPAKDYPLTPATPPADDASEWKYAIEDGWLVQVVNKHTCGTGPDGYYGAHEQGCGMVPVADISDLLAARESAAATRGPTVCDQEHGHEGNPARVYGHFGSNRTCIRLRATDEWVYDPAWEMTT